MHLAAPNPLQSAAMFAVSPASVDRAAAPARRAPGAGELEFTRVRGRTVLTRAFAASPLKVLCPRHAGASAWAYLATFGGGLVGGDAIDLSVTVGAGATALLATQASTKVYRSETGASQTLQADVADGGLLVLVPDPVTCFAGATYRQEQRVRLAPSASLVLVDRLTAGRVASGERWLFDRYFSRTRVWQGNRLLLHDAVQLTRDDGEIARRLDRFDVLASVVLLGPALASTAARLTGVSESLPVLRRADVLLSAAPLDGGGATLRMAARSVEQIASALRQHLSVVTSLLGDDPWIGK